MVGYLSCACDMVDGSGGWSCDVERCPYSRAEHLVQPQQFQFQALKKNGNWPNKTWLTNSISPRRRKHIREKIAQLVAMVLLTDFRGSGRGRGREKSTGSDEGEDFAGLKVIRTRTASKF